MTGRPVAAAAPAPPAPGASFFRRTLNYVCAEERAPVRTAVYNVVAFVAAVLVLRKYGDDLLTLPSATPATPAPAAPAATPAGSLPATL